MSDNLSSIDEFLSARKDFVKSGDILVKAARAPASWNAEQRTARFTMSAEIEDRDRDIIVQAGLVIDEFLKNPVAPFQHNSWTFPIGTWKDVEKNLNGRPKRTEGTLVLVPEGTDEVADRLAKHIEAGTIRACSIGFVPKSVRRREVPEDKKDSYYYPGYEILEAELVECSPVTIPANPAALAKSAANGNVFAREVLEEVLDNWIKNPATGLIMPRAEFEKAQKEASGNKTTVTLSLKTLPEFQGVLDGAKQVEGAITAFTAAVGKLTDAVKETAEEQAPADDDGDQEARPNEAKDVGLIRKALDKIFGETRALVEQAIRGQDIDDAEEEAAKAARKEALTTKVADLEQRLSAKGIAA